MAVPSTPGAPPAPRGTALRLRAPSRGAGLVTLALALVLLLIGADGPLAGLHRVGLDLPLRLRPRQITEAPVLVVAIDDDSLRRFGQWPWPRHLVAQLVRRIHADHPRVLGIDILWPEPDRLSPARWAAGERDLPADLAGRLAALPDHDTSLGDAIAAGPTVLGIAGLREGEDMAGALAPVTVHGGDLAGRLPVHTVLLRSVPEIDRAAGGDGLLSVDKDPDAVVRRLPMLAEVDGRIVPSLALEMLRLAAGARRIDAYLDGGGVRGLKVGPLSVPTEADGAIRLALSPSDPRRFVSATELLDGSLPPGSLEDRLILLGVTGLGLVDRVATPLGEMFGVELHAQLLETVLDGTLAVRPRWATAAEAGALLAIGAALIVLLPGWSLRWYAPAGIVGPALLGAAALGAWTRWFWVFDAVLPSLGSLAVLAALVGGRLVEVEALRRRLRRELEAQRLASARLAGELEAARRIQMGILPKPALLAGDPRFELDAVLEPAKEVGGDLYDFFLIGQRHLFVAVGDVTGKGVPASLFMALGKALYKSCVLRGTSLDPAAITEQANQEISRDNPEMLFITLFAGLLDLDTGRLVYCNAGHEPPVLLAPGAPPRLLDGAGGPPICVVEDFPYEANECDLPPGALLCIVSDGITEAMDVGNALFGHDRLVAALAALPPGAGAAQALGALRAAVAAFVGAAEPSDDLTALTVRWTGPGWRTARPAAPGAVEPTAQPA